MHPPAQDLLKLRELPGLTPPPDLWERVLEVHAARTAARRFRRRSLAAAAAVAVAVGVTVFVATRSGAPASPPVASIARPEPEAAGGDPVSYAPLVAESARLERLLAELPAPRPIMVGSTAGTIVGLEDRIAFVDAQLSYAAAQDLAPTYREALWGERVELMNALLHVRFAQTQAY
jgi:hypothetical protein